MKGLNVQEFFAPPLPFDGELLHSMQNLTNSAEWEGMALPGAHCSSRFGVFPCTDRTYWVLQGGIGWVVYNHLEKSTRMYRRSEVSLHSLPRMNLRPGVLPPPIFKGLRVEESFYCGLLAVCGIYNVLRRYDGLVDHEGDLRVCWEEPPMHNLGFMLVWRLSVVLFQLI